MGAPLRILCVDDRPDTLEITTEFLSRELPDPEIRSATDAAEALERLSEAAFDCVVSDYEMPDSDGLELLESVRETYPDLPFILFTGKGSEEIASEAISAGVTDYLQKRGPEQYELLANRIENSVSQYRAERDLEQVRGKLEHLHEVALDFRAIDDRQAAYRLASEAASEVLAFDTCGFFEVEDGEFEPRTLVNFPARTPRFDAEEGLIGETYQTGESYLIEDVRTVEVAEPARDSFRSCLSVPIGDHGVFQAISTAVGAYDERDRELAELLIAHLAASLDRVDYERDLERTNERLETVLENTTAHIYIKDLDGRYELVNETFAEQLGYPRAEILGKTDRELQGEEIAREVRENDRRAIEEARTIEVEESADWDGDERIYYSVKAPLFDDDGEPKGVCGVSSDITELKARERELERKTARLDEFASLVSHDLRNPLTVATANLELLDDADDQAVARIEDALSRMDELIEQLLVLARSGEPIGETRRVAVEAIATDAWRTVETGAADLTVECDRAVDADPGRLAQLFENLFRNSVEHGCPESDGDDAVQPIERESGGSGPQVQRSASAAATDDLSVRVEETPDGFAVQDDGPGLPSDAADSVFEPGFSTDPDGTGIGLAIVSRIASAHGWSVCACDCEEGARFEFSIEKSRQ